jgi:hypothetical protein
MFLDRTQESPKTSYMFINVSEESTGSISRAYPEDGDCIFPQSPVATYQTILCHNSEDKNMSLHSGETSDHQKLLST